MSSRPRRCRNVSGTMPVARFGLHEILYMIPSALIAEAAGLDAIGSGISYPRVHENQTRTS
ncbi:hypothetical protein [Xanthomonas sp. MUS 060]|uniref:hypothetical protein n=1 Tax=Xanthomonas sp. MUS 060 TaxID=1588031 RepID=UPI001F21A91A|nr:hypothetical protein [Xanthomonas sp. MUS 060]